MSLIALLLAFAVAGAGQVNQVSKAEADPIIGAGSCLNPFDCDGLGPNAVIGENSCNSTAACLNLLGTVGDNSCNAIQACLSFEGIAGDNSCLGVQSCISASGLIGNGSCTNTQSCVSLTGAVGDALCTTIAACVSFSGCEGLAGCNVEVTKSANPTSIPETGDTPVTYTVRIEFLEDEDLNWIEDDQYPGLSVAAHCRLNGGPVPTLPATFIIGDVIVCTYTYEPPPGDAGDTHDNIFTANVGHPDCPELDPTQVGPADHDCEIQEQAISPGEVPGTNDVTAEASVLYLEVLEPEPTPEMRRDPVRPQPPNIGAGLSGLFNGMPTPLPTAPSAVAPAATTIRPPNTGDGGIAEGHRSFVLQGAALTSASLLTLVSVVVWRRRLRI